jgi:hypothetical protein
MAHEYTFASLPQNRHCFGEHGETVEPCPDFPCIHIPCHDPDYLADLEDLCRDRAYYRRLWSNYRKANPRSWSLCVAHKGEEARREYEEARLKESEADRRESDKVKRRTLDSKEAQAYGFILPFDPTPVSETERKEFESKFDRCRRLDIEHINIAKADHRCSIEMILAEYKFDLEQWEDKDSDEYQQAVACRDQILGTFNPETGDYSWMWFED